MLFLAEKFFLKVNDMRRAFNLMVGFQAIITPFLPVLSKNEGIGEKEWEWKRLIECGEIRQIVLWSAVLL
jgi:hypothetical protein